MSETMKTPRARAGLRRMGRRSLLSPGAQGSLPGGRVDALGRIDVVAVENPPEWRVVSRLRRALGLRPLRADRPRRGLLTIEGWAASAGAGAVDRFEVSYAGRSFAKVRGELGLLSPDVGASSPHLDSAGKCRFRLQLSLRAKERARSQGAVVTCTPFFKGLPGCVLTRIIEPILSSPSQSDSNFVGSGDFLDVSQEFLGHIIHKGGLRPTDDVLDAGCGLGRIAYSLAHYMAPTARYEGFDIVDHLIAQAQGMITSRFPNFTFRKLDVYNKWYNPAGTVRSTELRFPFDDASFDFVFLTSVFTHMLAPEVRRYLDEIHRVLRPGGRCLCTCFLLTPESEALIQAGKSGHALVHELDECFTSNPEVPEDAIGFKEPLMLRWIAERGFTLKAKYPGSWCGRPITASYQDILILNKP